MRGCVSNEITQPDISFFLPGSALVCLVDGPDDEDVEDDHDAARHDPHEHEVGQQDVILQQGKEG